MPARLLPEMATSLGVSTAIAGQTVTIYAVGSVIAAIPLTRPTAAWPRREILLTALSGLLVANAVTAIFIQLRAHDGVPPRRRPRGLELILVNESAATANTDLPGRGQRQSNCRGHGRHPCCARTGHSGRHMARFRRRLALRVRVSVALTVLTIAQTPTTLPNLPGNPRDSASSLASVLNIAGLKTVLWVVAAFVIAHNILYTYVAAYLAHAHMQDQTQWVLFCFGVMALVSIGYVRRAQITSRTRTTARARSSRHDRWCPPPTGPHRAVVSTSTEATSVVRSQQLPWAALLGLFVAGFIAILTEAMPAGLLPEMATSLGVSTAIAGQTVTIYAVGSVIAAIPLTRLTAAWPRRQILLTALSGLLVANAVTAISSNYALTMAFRLVAGLAAGLIWSLVGGYGQRISPAGAKGKATAVAMGGIPVALALGIPAGTWPGSAGGWRFAFGVSVALTVLTIAWTLRTLPNLPGNPRNSASSLASVLNIAGLKTVLWVVAAFVIAHNILYTYVAAYLAHAHMQDQTQWVLFCFGVMALVSIGYVGARIDGHLRLLIVGSTVTFAVASLILVSLSSVPIFVYVGAAAWGLAFGSSGTLFTGAVGAVTGPAADVGQSMLVTVFNAGIALGGLLGGLLLSVFGPWSLAWSALLLTAPVAVTVIVAKRCAFPTDANPSPTEPVLNCRMRT